MKASLRDSGSLKEAFTDFRGRIGAQVAVAADPAGGRQGPEIGFGEYQLPRGTESHQPVLQQEDPAVRIDLLRCFAQHPLARIGVDGAQCLVLREDDCPRDVERGPRGEAPRKHGPVDGRTVRVQLAKPQRPYRIPALDTPDGTVRTDEQWPLAVPADDLDPRFVVARRPEQAETPVSGQELARPRDRGVLTARHRYPVNQTAGVPVEQVGQRLPGAHVEESGHDPVARHQQRIMPRRLELEGHGGLERHEVLFHARRSPVAQRFGRDPRRPGNGSRMVPNVDANIVMPWRRRRPGGAEPFSQQGERPRHLVRPMLHRDPGFGLARAGDAEEGVAVDQEHRARLGDA
ncbi:hypothetical protein C791_2576 [Amycolatopsis azurea DSM 43854]|uniref:Uncharacterized protein n=1 Tax=Amycolatopsis azurea DSM 43854 TaxID=1238180 RepID=M2PR74_9PSEU|nr:hypothetical protein C791_2576 [Amycolatopsis azurea DSM 43854]